MHGSCANTLLLDWAQAVRDGMSLTSAQSVPCHVPSCSVCFVLPDHTQPTCCMSHMFCNMWKGEKGEPPGRTWKRTWDQKLSSEWMLSGQLISDLVLLSLTLITTHLLQFPFTVTEQCCLFNFDVLQDL